MDAKNRFIIYNLIKSKTGNAYLSTIFNDVNLQLHGDNLNWTKIKCAGVAFLVQINLKKQNVGR